jgi:hypothetical protein
MGVESEPSMKPTRISVSTQTIALLFANVVGAIGYVMAASRGGWAIPAERAAGLYVTTGVPFIWFLQILPIVASFFVIKAVWAIVLARRHWRGARYFFIGVLIWLVAIAIDFAHH